MSGINDMMADMLRKLIPEEVMAMLTKEQIESMAEKVNAFVLDIRENFQTIVEAQADNHIATLHAIDELKELIINGPGKRVARGARDSGGSGTGSGDSPS